MCGQLNFLKNVGLPLGATETPPVILKLTRASTETFTFYIVCFKGLGRLEPRDLSPAMACPAQIRACSLVKAGVAQTRRS